MRVVSICLLLLLLPIADPALAREDASLSLLAHWAEGPSVAVAAAWDHVFLGHGGYIEILDFAEPTAPQLLGRHRLPGFVTHLAANGNLVLAGTEERGLHLLDAADPTAIAPLAFLPYDDYLRVLQVKGDLLFVLLSESLRIVDIADPALPVELGRYDESNLFSLAVVGEHAYVGRSPGVLLVINVGDPASPFLENSLPPEAGYPSYTQLAGAAGHLHALKRDFFGFHSYRIFDLSNPTQPVILGELDTGPDLFGFEVSGDWVYAFSPGSLWVYDIADPEEIPLAGSAPVLDRPYAVAARQELIYLAELDYGLQCFSTGGTRSDPVEQSRWGEGLHGAVTDVWREGGLLLAATTGPGLAIFDAEVLDPPLLVGSLYEHLPGETGTRGFQVSARGDLALLRCGDEAGNWLKLIDIADPTAPAELAALPGALMNPQISQDLLYAVDNSALELQVHDLAVPSAPMPVANLPLSDWSVHRVDGDRLFIATGDELVAFDITQPDQFVTLGATSLAWGEDTNFMAMAGGGEVLFVVAALTNGTAALRAVEVADPGAMVAHAGPPLADAPWDCLREGDYLYVAVGGQGVEAFSLTEPLAPVLAGSYRTGYWCWGIAGAGERLFAADSHDGIYVLRNDLVLTTVDAAPPAGMDLGCYPNPFNPRATVVFTLPAAGHARLTVHDVRGRRLRVLAQGHAAAGRHELEWDGRDNAGRPLSSGVYLLRLEARGARGIAKAVLLR